MLVLSRKVGQSIVINGNITVTINRITNGRVQIGIKAPREVTILRGELAPEQPKDETTPSPRETPKRITE